MGLMNELISVIIPVYNAEKFLREALEDVRQQTYKNIEIICIDDCSTDSSIDILREYQKNDERFRIFRNQERQGAAISRNICIEKAQGEYICFVDADDVCHRDMLQELYSAAAMVDAEVAICECGEIRNESISSLDEKFRSQEYIKKFCNKSFSVSECNLIEILDILLIPPWGKLIRRDFVLLNELSFQNLESSNDVYFAVMLFGLAENIIFTHTCKVLYGNRIHNTPSRISFHRDPNCAYWAVIKILDELKLRRISEDKIDYYLFVVVRIIITAIYGNVSEEEKIDYYNFLREKGIDELLDRANDLIRHVNNRILTLFQIVKSDKYNIDHNFRIDMHKEALNAYLDDNKDRIISLFKKVQMEQKTVGLWGIGFRGKTFYDYICSLGMGLDYLGDSNADAAGYRGKEILNIRSMVKLADVVIVSIKQISAREIYCVIGSEHKEIYDIACKELSLQ